MTNTKTVDFSTLSNEVIIAVCDILASDGHSFFNTGPLQEAGLPDEFVKAMTRTYRSNPSEHKQTIFDADGNAVTEMESIYGLDLYERIASDLGLPEPWQSGRGFRAREYDTRIRAHIAKRA